MLVLVAHPSNDLYGADLQMVETVIGLVEAGHQVRVVVPTRGPLTARLRAAGAAVQVVPFPVLRKAIMRPAGLVRFGWDAPRSLVRMIRLIRQLDPDAVVVNTVTIPAWLLAARLAGVPALCHVHEAEDDQARVVRIGIGAPLFAADQTVANSQAAKDAITTVLPRLAPRIRVVYNGVAESPGQQEPAEGTPPGRPFRLVQVGRLSPRKGTDVALEGLALLVAQGVDATIEICGTAYSGYEWFEAQLRERATRADLLGRVEFSGYVSDVSGRRRKADVVLVPSRYEPFGNVAVEAMLDHRPVVVAATQGLLEIVRDGVNGLTASPGDPASLAAAIQRLARSPELRRRLAEHGYDDARTRFSVQRYRHEMVDAVTSLVRGHTAGGDGQVRGRSGGRHNRGPGHGLRGGAPS